MGGDEHGKWKMENGKWKTEYARPLLPFSIFHFPFSIASAADPAGLQRPRHRRASIAAGDNPASIHRSGGAVGWRAGVDRARHPHRLAYTHARCRQLRSNQIAER